MTLFRFGYRVSILLLFSALWLQAASKEWYKNDAMGTLYEAVVALSSQSLYASSQENLPRQMLQTYIQKIDRYGKYFTKDEYQAFSRSLSSQYAGVGITLYQVAKSGDILVIPTQKELKEMGISQYDRLVSVNGKSVRGRNFYLIINEIRGEADSSVTLTIQKRSGRSVTLTLKRKYRHFKSVQRVIENGIAMIHIIQFTQATPKELVQILSGWPKNIPIVIDLRGNSGGDFYAAIRSADLLLPPKSLIAAIKTKEKEQGYQASAQDYSHKGRLVILLQDALTASAAELFIAALTQNSRAVSIGSKSFGKGVVQKFIPLSSGEALLLTFAKIITPDGKSYNEQGLYPTSDLSLKKLLLQEELLGGSSKPAMKSVD